MREVSGVVTPYCLLLPYDQSLRLLYFAGPNHAAIELLQFISMTMEADPRPVVRVAVIGLGAAGVAQVAQLLGAFARPEVSQRVRLEVVGFEARDTVGGVW